MEIKELVEELKKLRKEQRSLYRTLENILGTTIEAVFGNLIVVTNEINGMSKRTLGKVYIYEKTIEDITICYYKSII